MMLTSEILKLAPSVCFLNINNTSEHNLLTLTLSTYVPHAPVLPWPRPLLINSKAIFSQQCSIKEKNRDNNSNNMS